MRRDQFEQVIREQEIDIANRRAELLALEIIHDEMKRWYPEIDQATATRLTYGMKVIEPGYEAEITEAQEGYEN